MTDETCRSCGALYRPGAVFCSACGMRRVPLVEASELPFVIKYFVTMLAVMLPGILYVVHLDGDGFITDIALSAALLVVTLGFALARRSLWSRLYATAGFGPLGYLAIVLAAPLVLGLVLGYVHGLANAFGIHQPDELAAYAGHHVMWMVALLAIVPPIVEELAFRGLIYTGLRRSLGVSESFIISSFAFALLHLSLPTLITHLPLGLYFCYLRHRSDSLWPSMLAHALHNAGVIVVGQLGWA